MTEPPGAPPGRAETGPPAAATTEDARPLEGETIAQPEALQQVSREQSIPKGIDQHPEAPKIPGYILTRPLGRGAFAQVWRAWQIRTRKTLAVKVFTQSSGVNWLYLQREVERLIRLDKHPNIVSLFDADLAADPPFYAMDLMEGGSLERYVGSRERPPAGAVAKWAGQIADALAFVHAKGLLHCDLKPANVMLDAQGNARVADFGQSRILTDSAGALGTLFYMAPEQAVLNEDGAELHPDVRWDVFALGTTLYAVLAGRLPFAERRAGVEAAKSLRERLAAYRAAIASGPLAWEGPARGQEEDLRAIIAKCAEPLADTRYQSVASFVADIEAMRALMPVSPLAAHRGYRARRFVQRRFALVVLGALAAAGLLFTGAQVLQARSDGDRRLAGSYSMRGRLFSEQGDDASAAAYYAEAYRLSPSALSLSAALAHVEQLTIPLRVYHHRWGVRTFALSPDGTRLVTGSWEKGASFWDTGAGESDRRVLDHAAPVTAVDFDPAGKEFVTADREGTLRLWSAVSGAMSREWRAQGTEITVARFSPDGKAILTAGPDQPLRLWNVATGTRLGPDMPHGGELSAASFSPDGSRVAAVTSKEGLRLWDAATGLPQPALGRSKGGDCVSQAFFSPDGRRLACLTSYEGGVSVWDLGANPPAPIDLPLKSATSLAFSPQSARLAIGFSDGSAQVWDAVSRLPAGLPSPTGPAVREVAFLPDGGAFMTGDKHGVVRFWNALSGEPVSAPLRHSGPIFKIAVSGNGSVMATAADDGTVRLWKAPRASWASAAPEAPAQRAEEFTIHSLDLKSVFGWESLGALLTDPKGGVFVLHGGELRDAAGERIPGVTGQVRPDRRSVGLSTSDKSVQFLELTDGDTETAGSGNSLAPGFPAGLTALRLGGAMAMSLSSDGSRLLTAGGGAVVRIWDAGTGSPVNPVTGAGERVEWAAFDAGGRVVLTAASDGSLQIRDPFGTRPPKVLGKVAGLLSAAFSSDGSMLVTGDESGATRFWDLDKPGEPSSSLLGAGSVGAVAFSPDGRVAAAGAADGSISLFGLEHRTARRLARLTGHDEWVAALAFSPDGRRLLGGSWNGTARLWDIPRCLSVAEAAARRAIERTREKEQERKEQERKKQGTDNKRVRAETEKALKDAGESSGGPAETSCKPAGPSLGHSADVSAVAFDSEGRRAASADWGREAVVWETATGRPLGVTMRHARGVSAIAFSPDGTMLLTGSWDGTARLFDSETGEPIWRPVSVGSPVTGVAFSADGSRVAAAGAGGGVRVWPAPRGFGVKAPALLLRSQLGGQRRVNEKGDIETVPTDELRELRASWAEREGR